MSAGREGRKCEHQLDTGRRTVGGGQHHHGTEAGLRSTLTSLQTRPLHPLEQTLSKGEAKLAQGRWRLADGISGENVLAVFCVCKCEH